MRAKTDLPLVVGFGISNSEMVKRVSNLSDGAVVGSFLTDCIGIKNEGEIPDEDIIYEKVMYLNKGTIQVDARNQAVRFSQVQLPEQVNESSMSRFGLNRRQLVCNLLGSFQQIEVPDQPANHHEQTLNVQVLEKRLHSCS